MRTLSGRLRDQLTAFIAGVATALPVLAMRVYSEEGDCIGIAHLAWAFARRANGSVEALAMETYIEACEAKIGRAKVLLNELAVKSERAIEAGGYKVKQYIDEEKCRYVYTLLGPDPPLELSVIMGEIVHHLRSSLDYLIWGVSTAKSTRTMFPICQKREEYRNAVKNLKRLDGVPAKFISLVETLQPYNQVLPERSIIKLVHELNILDKHRLLLLTKNVVSIGQIIEVCGRPRAAITFTVDPSHFFFYAHEDGEHFRYIEYEPVEAGRDWWITTDYAIKFSLSIAGEFEHEPIVPLASNLILGVEKILDWWRMVAKS